MNKEEKKAKKRAYKIFCELKSLELEPLNEDSDYQREVPRYVPETSTGYGDYNETEKKYLQALQEDLDEHEYYDPSKPSIDPLWGFTILE